MSHKHLFYIHNKQHLLHHGMYFWKFSYNL